MSPVEYKRKFEELYHYVPSSMDIEKKGEAFWTGFKGWSKVGSGSAWIENPL